MGLCGNRLHQDKELGKMSRELVRLFVQTFFLNFYKKIFKPKSKSVVLVENVFAIYMYKLNNIVHLFAINCKSTHWSVQTVQREGFAKIIERKTKYSDEFQHENQCGQAGLKFRDILVKCVWYKQFHEKRDSSGNCLLTK